MKGQERNTGKQVRLEGETENQERQEGETENQERQEGETENQEQLYLSTEEVTELERATELRQATLLATGVGRAYSHAVKEAYSDAQKKQFGNLGFVERRKAAFEARVERNARKYASMLGNTLYQDTNGRTQVRPSHPDAWKDFARHFLKEELEAEGKTSLMTGTAFDKLVDKVTGFIAAVGNVFKKCYDAVKAAAFAPNKVKLIKAALNVAWKGIRSAALQIGFAIASGVELASIKWEYSKNDKRRHEVKALSEPERKALAQVEAAGKEVLLQLAESNPTASEQDKYQAQIKAAGDVLMENTSLTSPESSSVMSTYQKRLEHRANRKAAKGNALEGHATRAEDWGVKRKGGGRGGR